MPGAVSHLGKKRKRKIDPESSEKRARPTSIDDGEDDESPQARILLLENEILESKKNYNNITTLIDIAQKQGDEEELVASVSLCRVFIRLMASGSLTKKQGASEKQETITRWLRERLYDYKKMVMLMFQREDTAMTALTLSMRLLKAEAEHLNSNGEYSFPGASLAEIVSGLVQPTVDDKMREEYMERFMNENDDIRYYTFKTIR
jgi:U3 small nucleolar RNA-associated protein 19